MSYASTRRSESSASRRSLDMDTLDDLGDDRDETKRKSRNLSEKKRRDQFNILINELCSMVSSSPRKMDKSTVLKATIAFLKTHNELSVQSQVQETQEDWKPSFLSNEEFTHLMMESLDGFILVISSTGQILYLSESVTSLLGHLSSDLVNCSIYDYVAESEKTELHNVLSSPVEDKGRASVSMILNFRLGGFGVTEENFKYQLIRITGYFKRWISSDCKCANSREILHNCAAFPGGGGGGSETNTEKSEGEFSESNDSSGTTHVFIATGRVIDADLLREMSVVVDTAKNEFSSRHSLEWKFLFLDHRAPPIIGYLPFEVLGTSGYDYYHAEDLDKIANCHEALMQKGEGTSCFYRFLTKGQQWIWLQTRFYITYHQWNSKPEFIVCTHRVVGYADVMKEIRGEIHRPPSPHHLGPSLPKQPKLESKKNAGFIKFSKKNGSMSYGCVGSKRGFMRKLDLPPKFVSALSTSHSVMLQPQKIMTQNSPISDSILYPQPTTVTVALHPKMPHFIQPVQPPQNLAVPIATFHSSPMGQNQMFGISSGSEVHDPETPRSLPPVSSSQCVLQEQLLMKHAELQRQIMQQQEELRRVSEQLLMSQCGFTQGDQTSSRTTQPEQVSPTNHSSEESSATTTVHLQQVK